MTTDEKVTMKIRINDRMVTLVVEGRETVRVFATHVEARAVYDHFKARLIQEEAR